MGNESSIEERKTLVASVVIWTESVGGGSCQCYNFVNPFDLHHLPEMVVHLELKMVENVPTSLT